MTERRRAVSTHKVLAAWRHSRSKPEIRRTFAPQLAARFFIMHKIEVALFFFCIALVIVAKPMQLMGFSLGQIAAVSIPVAFGAVCLGWKQWGKLLQPLDTSRHPKEGNRQQRRKRRR